ncbi:MAG: hypothetical protein AB8G11_05175 [Saprospiraceae bacterium]
MITIFCCQLTYGQTTQEEYNFITKGYRFTIDYGLDMKQGYTMTRLKDYNFSTSFHADIMGLFRVSGDLAGYLVRIKDGTFNKDICIPTENSANDIWQQYDYLLQSLPLSTQRYYTIILSQFLSQKTMIYANNTTKSDTLNGVAILDSEEGTGGIIIPKKTNPLLPGNVEGINHHSMRFIPDPPQTAKEVNGNIKLNFCVNKEGDITEAKIIPAETNIKDADIISLVLANVRKYKFSLNVYAPDRECGYITYTFTKTEQDE